ncbi:uncharacterized protein MELLADRAFT_101554 [Melampsora larici-populina 98AG31]|uniref:DUF3074 domain-containing protein n=1 Tax=Melampsora larici-populina (strain 98AG31 / pathotype 3-4-7) TaxID=747676 RepID=F4R682_MELLP|nr:uncharacterized protein MELLADRAFT_101554 [Melampsora larici-populina 98AG31]EGG12512.1 hypothetical protein MELLADRAFT_101554 [Melampsora larici-populina 98AG31]
MTSSLSTFTSLSTLNPKDIPTEETELKAFISKIVSEAQAKIDSTDTWKTGKVYQNGIVTTKSHQFSGEKFKWHLRESYHNILDQNSSLENDLDGIGWDMFYDNLFMNHTENEVKYIESCESAHKLQVIKQGSAEIWRTCYKLAFPMTDRDFVFLILTQETTPDPTGPRSFLIISLPILHPFQTGHTRGKYISIEEVKEEILTSNDNNQLERKRIKWKMIIQSDAGGMVPIWISDLALPSKISEE